MARLTSMKGQTSIEFMIIILLMLIYLTTQIQPAMLNAGNALNDTKIVAQASIAARTIASSISEVGSLSGQSQKTITVFIPKGIKIECGFPEPTNQQQTAKIYFTATLENRAPISHKDCKQNLDGIMECLGTINANISSTSVFGNCEVINPLDATNGAITAKLVISKTDSAVPGESGVVNVS